MTGKIIKTLICVIFVSKINLIIAGENDFSIHEQIDKFYEESKLYPDNIELHVMLAKALKSAHRFDEAKDVMERIQEKYPQNPSIKHELSEALHILDKTDITALSLAKECVSLRPNHKVYLEYYGYMQQQFGLNKEAVETFQQLVAMDSDNGMYGYQLASALHFSGENEKAVEHLNRLNEDSPQSHTHALLGRIYQSTGKMDQAEIELSKALEIDPNNHLAAEELGKIYLAQNKAEKAVEFLSLAVEHNPFSTRAATKLSEALFRNQQREKAQGMMKRVEYLRSYPEQKRYQLHHLYENGAVKIEENKLMASEFFQLGMPHKAKPHLQFIIEHDVEDLEAAYAMASMEFQQRNFEETLQLLLKLDGSAQAKTDYYQAMMVICLVKTGDVKEAKTWLDKAKELFPGSANVRDAETILNQETQQ